MKYKTESIRLFFIFGKKSGDSPAFPKKTAAAFLLALALALAGCGYESGGDLTLLQSIGIAFTDGPVADYSSLEAQSRGRLLTAQRKWDLEQVQMQLMVGGYLAFFGSSLDEHPVFAPDNGAKFYVITYETVDTDGVSIITASGALWIPKKGPSDPMPLLSYGHGTVITTDITNTRIEPGLFAAKGYVAASTDYIGYGASSAKNHPYCHAKTMASSTIDMLRAARKFARYNNITINNRLFIMGYSEGGMTAMSTVKTIEGDAALKLEFPITAAAPMSGPYDIRGTADQMIQPNKTVVPEYLTFILPVYRDIYSLVQPLNYYIDATIAASLGADYFPRADGSSFAASLPTNTSALLQAAFITSYMGGGETDLKSALDANNTYNFTPKTSMRLYGGVADTRVPITNTTRALSYFAEKNASRVTSEVLDSSYGDHTDLVLPIYDRVLGYFGGFL